MHFRTYPRAETTAPAAGSLPRQQQPAWDQAICCLWFDSKMHYELEFADSFGFEQHSLWLEYPFCNTALKRFKFVFFPP